MQPVCDGGLGGKIQVSRALPRLHYGVSLKAKDIVQVQWVSEINGENGDIFKYMYMYTHRCTYMIILIKILKNTLLNSMFLTYPILHLILKNSLP